ncbi:Ras-related protein Rab-38 [Turdus rufiventris]|nr:Ras-related protein Rab-38 [Turdus rufiventris]
MQKHNQKEHLYKLLVIGDLGVGKTSIIKRYVHQNFSPHYRATIGVDFALKVLNWDAETVVRLQLWDIAGQERFGNMTRVYYREAMGAFIVFDVTRPATFEAVTKWKEDLDSKLVLPNGKPVPAVLLANKCDQGIDVLMNNGIKMDQFCKENGFVGWFETSAKVLEKEEKRKKEKREKRKEKKERKKREKKEKKEKRREEKRREEKRREEKRREEKRREEKRREE